MAVIDAGNIAPEPEMGSEPCFFSISSIVSVDWLTDAGNIAPEPEMDCDPCFLSSSRTVAVDWPNMPAEVAAGADVALNATGESIVLNTPGDDVIVDEFNAAAASTNLANSTVPAVAMGELIALNSIEDGDELAIVPTWLSVKAARVPWSNFGSSGTLSEPEKLTALAAVCKRGGAGITAVGAVAVFGGIAGDT